MLRRLLRNRSGAVGLAIVAFYVLLALLGGLRITPFQPAENHPRDRLKPPSETYVMGTDLLGRDVASRIMEGAANSFRVALLSVALATTVGTLLGTLSGYLGGWVDNAIMRTMDVFFALPALLMALVVVSVLGAGVNTTVLAIAFVYTPIFARVTRAPVLSVKAMEFVVAARSIGVRGGGILWRHIPQHPRAAHRAGQPRAFVGAPHEAGLSFLAWARSPRRLVGRDAQREPGLSRKRAVADDRARCGDHAWRPRLQSAR